MRAAVVRSQVTLVTLSALFALSAATSSVACGGTALTVEPAGDADRGDAPVDAPVADGWRSFTMTITDATVAWIPGGGPPLPAGTSVPSKGWVGRIDLERRTPADGTASAVRAFVVSAPFSAPLTGTSTESAGVVTLKGLDSYALISVNASVGGQTLSDQIAQIVVQFDAAGAPTTATFTGHTGASSGDVAWQGDLTGAISFAPDTTAPSLESLARATCADVALPWDPRAVIASEPYEEQLQIDQLVTGGAASDFTLTRLASPLWEGASRERGVRFVTRDWDAAPGLAFPSATLTDLAGNRGALLPGPHARYGGATVGHHGASAWRADDGKPAAFLWGTAAPTKVGCESGTCVAIGPFDLGFRCGRTQGGLATRLLGSGATTFRVRATAKPKYGRFDGTPLARYLSLVAATPGVGAVVATDFVPPAWGAANSDGSFDTGWSTVTTRTASAGAETGVALSVAGTGAVVCGDVGLTPPPFVTTVYVQRISVAGGT